MRMVSIVPDWSEVWTMADMQRELIANAPVRLDNR